MITVHCARRLDDTKFENFRNTSHSKNPKSKREREVIENHEEKKC